MQRILKNHFKIFVFCIFGIMAVNDSSASLFVKEKFNGMSVEQAFTDKRVSSLVDSVSHGHFKEADKQLAAGAEANAVGKDGLSPLLWVIHATEYDLEKMEYLLKAGANPNYINTDPTSVGRGDSAMSWAAHQSSLKPLRLLLRYKGDPNLLGPSGDPLLYQAALSGRKDVIDVLLEHEADINIEASFRGDTVGNPAARGGDFELVAYLLERGLSYNLQGLAKSVDGSSGDKAIKAKVIDMLKARGAKFPAFNPNDPRDPAPWDCDRKQNRNVRCDLYNKS